MGPSIVMDERLNSTAVDTDWVEVRRGAFENLNQDIDNEGSSRSATLSKASTHLEGEASGTITGNRVVGKRTPRQGFVGRILSVVPARIGAAIYGYNPQEEQTSPDRDVCLDNVADNQEKRPKKSSEAGVLQRTKEMSKSEDAVDDPGRVRINEL